MKTHLKIHALHANERGHLKVTSIKTRPKNIREKKTRKAYSTTLKKSKVKRSIKHCW